MAKKNSVTMRIKSVLEKLDEKVIHKGGSKIGVTKKNKSKSKKNLRIEKTSKRRNRKWRKLLDIQDSFVLQRKD